MNDIEEFWRKNNKLILTITLILIIIIFSIVFYNYKINDYSITLVQFLTGIGGLITLGGLFLNVYYLDKRDKKSQEQIKLTNEQIRNQEKTRKDQQFLDAIKLIEETKDINSKIAYLKILENLANEDIDYRLPIFYYLGNQTLNLKEETMSTLEKISIPQTFKITKNKEFDLNCFFKEFKIIWYGTNKNINLININNLLTGIKFNQKIYKNLSHEILIKKNHKEEYYEFSKNKNPHIIAIPSFKIRKGTYIEINYNFVNSYFLKGDYLEYLSKYFKFENKCLKLLYKIINLEYKKNTKFNFDEIFIPFLEIQDLKNKEIIGIKKENYIGLIMNYSKNNLISKPNFTSYENYKHFSIGENKFNSFLNIKILNLMGNNQNNEFKNSKIFFESNIGDNELKFEKCKFINCEISNGSFLLNKNIFNPEFSIFNWKTINFNNCQFEKTKFNHLIVNYVSFKDITNTKIKGLETVQILSNNKERLNEMIKGFKDLISKNSEIGIPQFPNAKWVEKELKNFKKGNFIK